MHGANPLCICFGVGQNTIKKDVNKSHVMEFISQDGMRELLATPDTQKKQGLRDQFFMALIYDTAARNCEMLGMRYGDFHAENNTVYLFGKGSKPRLVPVSKETTALFKKYSRRFHADGRKSDLLFYTMHIARVSGHRCVAQRPDCAPSGHPITEAFC